jgi:hypothetical protein
VRGGAVAVDLLSLGDERVVPLAPLTAVVDQRRYVDRDHLQTLERIVTRGDGRGEALVLEQLLALVQQPVGEQHRRRGVLGALHQTDAVGTRDHRLDEWEVVHGRALGLGPLHDVRVVGGDHSELAGGEQLALDGVAFGDLRAASHVAEDLVDLRVALALLLPVPVKGQVPVVVGDLQGELAVPLRVGEVLPGLRLLAGRDELGVPARREEVEPGRGPAIEPARFGHQVPPRSGVRAE